MRQTWFYSLLLPLCVVILFAPVVFGGKTLLPADQLNTMFLPYSAKYDSVQVYNHFLTDAIAQVYPYKVRLREGWLRGEFAAWNPSILGGHPHYASTSFTPFDPTNIVLLLGEMPAAYHAQMLAKLCIAGIAMWCLLGFFTVGGTKIHAALRTLFALAYMLNSLFITTLQHQWVLGVFCWMPLSVLFLLKYCAEKRIASALWSGVFLGLGFLGGSLQTNAIAVLLFVIVGVFAAMNEVVKGSQTTISQKSQTRMSALLKIGGVMLGIGLFAFMLTAFMWLPSLELFLYNFNVRAAGKPFSLLNGIKSIPLLFTFAVPELLGTVRGFDLAKIAQADMNDFTAFIGFAPMFFGLLGAATLWNKMPAVRGFIVLAGVGVCMPLFTPLYKFLYHRSFVIYMFGMTVVGAVAAQEIIFGTGEFIRKETLQRAVKWGLLVMLCVIAALLLGNIVLWWKYDIIAQKLHTFVAQKMIASQLAAGSEGWMLGREEAFLAHFALWKNPILLLVVIIPVEILLLIRKYTEAEDAPHRANRLIGVLGGLTFVQLAMFAYSWLPMINTNDYPLYPPTQTTDFLRKDSSLYRFIPLFDDASQRVMQPNMNDMHGLSASEGYESVFPLNVSRLSSALFMPVPTQQLMLAGLINVKYYVSSAKNRFAHPALTLVDSGAVLVYQNAYWQERAYMRYSYRLLEANERNKLVAVPSDSTYPEYYSDSTKFSQKTLLFWREPVKAIQHPENADIPHSLRFLNYENNRVRLQVETAEEGYLVLADTYYPGWKVFVNGEERVIMRANYMLRAVVVPKGTSMVEFRFEPPLFRYGVYASIGALCVALVLGFVFRKR